MHNHVAHCSGQNGSQMLFLSEKNSVEKPKRHWCGEKLQEKGQEIDTALWLILYLQTPLSGSVQPVVKSFFLIKEPKQEQKYCNSQNILNYWQNSMAAGYPPNFSAHPSVPRTHNKIKQMETPLYIRGNVDRLLFSVILIFLSTTFCNKKTPQESLWLHTPVNDT